MHPEFFVVFHDGRLCQNLDAKSSIFLGRKEFWEGKSVWVADYVGDGDTLY